ncbi:MAG: hypothetical protein BWK77_04115 [Verrucomicrobia bacterium A1]|nr:MAG: hypothetical protein BWK77_04115 [Verrucomicrobia bacterium A1]
MNAEPIILRIARASATARLEAIIIGNSGAALRGAPVTTMDFDLFVRDIETDDAKIRAFAAALGALILRSDPALTRTVKIEDPTSGLFVDLIDRPAGMKSFAAVRKRASRLRLGPTAARLYVASMADIIASKRMLGRPKDLALLPILEAARHEAR